MAAQDVSYRVGFSDAIDAAVELVRGKKTANAIKDLEKLQARLHHARGQAVLEDLQI